MAADTVRKTLTGFMRDWFTMVLAGTLPAQPVSGTVTTTPSGTQTVTGTVTTVAPTGSNFIYVSAATTNSQLIKSTIAYLTELTVSNVTAATIYLKLYNKTTAPTVGTDVPVLTVPIAAGAFLGLTFPVTGKRFPSGLGLAVTAAAAATDTTAVTVGAQISGTYI